MSTNAIKARGTVISIDATGHKTIGEIVRWSGPQKRRDTIETTDLSEATESFIAGLGRSGELSCGIQAYPTGTGQAAVEAAYDAGSTDEYKITFTDGTIYTFDGIVTDLTYSGDLGSVTTMDLTVKVTGAYVET